MTAIKFGTSGWRAIVADEFTLANIRLAVAGIAAYVKTQPAPHSVLVGRDPRFLGENFVAEAARVLAGSGITPIVIPEAAPTPAIAYAVRTLKTSGAINFTASHNPPEYNGIKFSTHDGAPALPEVTKQIEAAIAVLEDGAKIPLADPPAGGFATADVKPDFLERISELVDINAIVHAGINVVYDPFWGAGRGYSSEILREAGVTIHTVHDYRDVLFGGHAPEPDDYLLGAARSKMKDVHVSPGHCDRWRCRPLRHSRSGWNLHPAELHHRTTLRLLGGDTRLDQRRGQECGHNQPDQCTGRASQSAAL